MVPMSIVVGIDGSDASGRALTLAAEFAARQRGRVYACYVAHMPGSVALGTLVGPAIPVGDDLNEIVESLGRMVGEELGKAEVGGDFSWRQGDIATELQGLAAEQRADLLIVGRSAHPHLHIGNVPSRLIATARQPVIVVP